MVKIELIQSNNNPMFFLPGGKLHLTQNSGAVEFDPSTLTAEEKKIINLASLRGVVKLTGTDVVQANEAKDNSSTETKNNPTKNNLQEVKVANEHRDSMVAKLTKLPAAGLKAHISTENNISVLRELLAKENEKKKPRKSIVDQLNAKLEKLTNLVKQSIGSDDVEGHYTGVTDKINKDIVSEVSFEEEEECEILIE